MELAKQIIELNNEREEEKNRSYSGISGMATVTIDGKEIMQLQTLEASRDPIYTMGSNEPSFLEEDDLPIWATSRRGASMQLDNVQFSTRGLARLLGID